MNRASESLMGLGVVSLFAAVWVPYFTGDTLLGACLGLQAGAFAIAALVVEKSDE